MQQTDVLIIGCGISGCTTALEVAKQGAQVTLVTSSSEARDSSSFNAQEGISYTEDAHAVASLRQDLLAAGGDWTNPRAIDQLVEEGGAAVRDFLMGELEVNFDRTTDGQLRFDHSPEHSEPRLLHASDHVGKVVIDAMLRKIAELPNVQLVSDHSAVDLLTLAQHSKKHADAYKKPACLGAYLLNHQTGEIETVLAKETVIATGGVGETYLHTTNAASARGDGLAMAHRAGARLLHLEFLQFYPTALYIPNERRRILPGILSEPGAQLLTKQGIPFLQVDQEGSEVQRLNGLARGIYQEMQNSGSDHVWLDLTGCEIGALREKMPNVLDFCEVRGFDLSKDPLPVVPSAHYLCGGIAVDRHGRSTIDRLRAVGEVTCTGTHGAARLPSIGLLESLVWGRACAADMAKQLDKFAYYLPPVEECPQGSSQVDPALIHQDWATLKQTLWNYVGPVRGPRRLRRAVQLIRELQDEVSELMLEAKLTPQLVGLRHALSAGALMAEAASAHRSSAGCHHRLAALQASR